MTGSSEDGDRSTTETGWRKALHVGGLLVVGGARLGVVAAALCVPAYVLYEQRGLLEATFAPDEVAAAPSSPGAATLLLGRPSGQPPRPRPVVAAPRSPESDAAEGEDSSAEAPPESAPQPVPDPLLLPPDFEVVVAKGLTLGEISATYYGTSRPRYVQALAAYNGLSDPNKLRLGQKLRVPHRDKLGLATP